MAFLGRYKKCDLEVLAVELGEPVTGKQTTVEIINLIKNSTNFETELVKDMLETIKDNRIEKEKMAEAEKERNRQSEEAERERKRQSEEAERERKRKRQSEDAERERKRQCEEAEKQREYQEVEKQRQFELEKLRLGTLQTNPGQINLIDAVNSHKNTFVLQQILQKFDPKAEDISLFLVIFERQAKRFDIRRENWVTQLLPLLPPDIIKFIARESEEKSDDYDYIKDLLLKRFKLSPEKFRIKLNQCQKKANSSWKDIKFELKNYLEEWIQGLNIKDFDSLKDLIVTDQLKSRVPSEVREHFIDNWTKIISSEKLSEMLDEYDSVRENRTLSYERNKPYVQGNNKFKKYQYDVAKFSRYEENWRKQDNRHPNYKQLDRRKPMRCYECGSTSHLRPQCPNLNSPRAAQINRIYSEKNDENLMKPYISVGQVNGYVMKMIRDSGSTIDLISQKYVKSEMYTGERVWIQQALDETRICLPIAKVNISGPFGNVETSAAVVRNKLDRGHYLLGNETANKIEQQLKEQNDKKLRKQLLLSENAMETESDVTPNLGKNLSKGLNVDVSLDISKQSQVMVKTASDLDYLQDEHLKIQEGNFRVKKKNYLLYRKRDITHRNSQQNEKQSPEIADGKLGRKEVNPALKFKSPMRSTTFDRPIKSSKTKRKFLRMLENRPGNKSSKFEPKDNMFFNTERNSVLIRRNRNFIPSYNIT